MSISQNFGNVSPSLLLDFANTKTLDRRITFTRSTPACHYDGKTTAMAEQNLLLQSQTFDNSPWSATQLTVTGNVTTAPDGTNTADSIVPNTVSTANHQFSQVVNLTVNKLFTLSIYVKAFGYTKFAFREANITGAYATFNLASSGSVVSTASIGEVTISGATISSVGNDWFRVTISLISTSSALSMGFFALNDTYTSGDPYSAGVATGNGTSGVYIWGAQLEQRSSATAYTATTTQPITNYIPVLQTAASGVARFDHNPTTDESLGLLIEEQRTNSLLYSGAINSTNWVITQASADANTIVAPDGTLTGSKIYVGSGLTQGNAYATPTYTYGSANTGAVYFKAGEFGWGVLELRGTDGSKKSAWFNLLTGVVGTVSSGVTATITPVGNGWYRCTVSAVLSSGASTTRYRMYPTNGDNTYTTGNGFSGIYVWGAQLETGASFATSYIATTSASATRTADLAQMTGTNFSSWFNNSGGTLYGQASFVGYTPATSSWIAQISDGTTNNNISCIWYNGTPIYAVDSNASVVVNLSSSAISANQFMKFALVNAFNNSAVSFNADTVLTDTSCTLALNLNKLNIGFTQNYGGQYLNGYIKKIAYYPLPVTNTNLQALTS